MTPCTWPDLIPDLTWHFAPDLTWTDKLLLQGTPTAASSHGRSTPSARKASPTSPLEADLTCWWSLPVSPVFLWLQLFWHSPIDPWWEACLQFSLRGWGCSLRWPGSDCRRGLQETHWPLKFFQTSVMSVMWQKGFTEIDRTITVTRQVCLCVFIEKKKKKRNPKLEPSPCFFPSCYLCQFFKNLPWKPLYFQKPVLQSHWHIALRCVWRVGGDGCVEEGGGGCLYGCTCGWLCVCGGGSVWVYVWGGCLCVGGVCGGVGVGGLFVCVCVCVCVYVCVCVCVCVCMCVCVLTFVVMIMYV